jgi:sigma-B regulation protein RsbU (phosphoserine phosphatase)
MTTPDPTPVGALLGLVQGNPAEQLAYVVDTMRTLSAQTDPQQMVRDYGDRVRRMLDIDCTVTLSRRDVPRPKVLVTRSSLTDPNGINPWTERHLLPVVDHGLLCDLIWGDVPVVLNDLHIDPADPAHRYLGQMRSLAAIPLYEGGQSVNMVVLARRVPGGFDDRHLPEHVWMSNLFGRATHTLVLSQEVRRAYDAVDRELANVAAIQRSLLPRYLPAIPTLDLAAHYQTSRRAGGDYYDFLPLPGGRWGILMADVSGHGTPAAVIMAVVHSLVLNAPADLDDPPGRLLAFVNDRLANRYTGGTGTFVTAFYGVYDPATRSLTYASAGHPSPLLRRASSGGVINIDGTRGLPMGIDADEPYPTATIQLAPGDLLLIYTDGFSEARSPDGDFLGPDGLSATLADAPASANDVMAATLARVEAFTDNAAPTDDRTLIAVRVG